MECLEGKDLSHRLAEQRILPPQEVATIITQVGKTLSRAHAAGILHRDIKPENIFLCDHPDGEIFAKLLDFGIAKAQDGALAVEIHGRLPMPSAVNPSLPPALDGWFAKACAREPAARFANAKELAATLTAVITVAAARAILPSFVEPSEQVSVAHTRSSTGAGTSVRVPPPERPKVIALAAIGVTVAVVAFIVVVGIAGRLRPTPAASVTSGTAAASASPSVAEPPPPPPSTLPEPASAASSSGLATAPSAKSLRRRHPAPSTSSRKIAHSHKIDNDDIK